jgi:branched-chain amino acid aminotransferase
MILYNGTLVESDEEPILLNRGFLFGDAIFETMKIVKNKILFFEDHYFRLMSSMRIARMQIPMEFTMEFCEELILSFVKQRELTNSRVRMTVFRDNGGLYQPEKKSVSYILTAENIENPSYSLSSKPFEIDLYKDNFCSKQLLSTIKSNNKLLHVLASIYAQENDLDSCILLNTDKNVAEAISGNLFMVIQNKIVTPPITDGCLNGVMRKQISAEIIKRNDFTFEERSISPFELQSADELFITNVITGIQPITKYRKKEYGTEISRYLIEKMNTIINSN